ncbi:hypothetical protein EIP86_000331 [Pleurotus ostreatoroseus]|nr:hypothetical protein EIP86_000331 [Pleurotus ostreatoroseus]
MRTAPKKQRDEPQSEISRPHIPDWMMHPDSTSPPHQFNPLLVGESCQQTLVIVDLRVSSYTYEPKRLASPGATTGSALRQEELSQPATYPGVTEMTITCDEIPQWKIELKPLTDPLPAFHSSERRRETPPLTVHDVLSAIQRSIRSHITHEEWAELSSEQQKACADAYLRRCRANPDTKVFEESQGVRRVDYLLEKHFFKGLVLPKGPEPFKNVKLIVGKK